MTLGTMMPATADAELNLDDGRQLSLKV